MSTRGPRVQCRLGCAQCRKRRIKCDQGRPDCKNCSRRRLDCSFRTYDPIPRPLSKRKVSAEEISSSPEGSIATLSPPTFLDYLPQDELLTHFPDVLRPRFRQLLQHFALETSHTIAHNEAARAAWCAAVPQLTAKHMFVLQGFMAISALHVSKFAENDREKKHFRDIATYQMNTGLIQYREAVANVTGANAESLLAFSTTATAWVILTTADDFMTLFNPVHENGWVWNEEAAVQSIVAYTSKILRTLRGVLVILIPCWHLIANGILSAVATRDWWPYPVPATPEAFEDDKRLAHIESMWMRPDRPYDYKFDSLRQALKALRDDFARISQLTVKKDANRTSYGKLIDWTSVLTWPIGVPLSFVEHIEARQPEAWVILAHYAILPSKVEHVFWLQDFGPNFVSAAALVVGEKMRVWIEWPAREVGVDLDALYLAHRHASATPDHRRDF